MRDAENRSRAEVLYHLRPTHAYLVKRSTNNANQREKYMDEGFTNRESRHPLDRPCSIFHCLYFYWSNFPLVGLYITLKLAQKHMKSPFFVVNSRPYCHCRSFVKKNCLLSRIYFMRCRYFLGHAACWNLPWQGLMNRNLSVLLYKVARCFLLDVIKNVKAVYVLLFSYSLSKLTSI